MLRLFIFRVLIVFGVLVFFESTMVYAEGLTSNASLESRLREAALAAHVQLHVIGRSVEDSPLWAVRLYRGKDKDSDAQAQKVSDQECVALLVGQQHGDEPAGCEALLKLIGELSLDASKLSHNLDLWIVPRINPDGAERQKRRNANDKDLNRDHLILSQPETKAIHQLARKIRPHLFVDCHEFGRDSSDYTKRGWLEWPAIMLDTANLPIMPDALYDAGVELCDNAGERLNDLRINFTRYIVGDCPCAGSSGELRYSTLDSDDARNGISLYGCVSFIIESGMKRAAADPQADLRLRIDAYEKLFKYFFDDEDRLSTIRDAAVAARSQPAPQAIPTNVFWGNTTARNSAIRVIELNSGGTLNLATTTLMQDRIVKAAASVPKAYLIDAKVATQFAALLDAHAISYTMTEEPIRSSIERTKRLRIEGDYDEVYHRYEGRQVMEPLPIEEQELPVGTLKVELSTLSAIDSRRAMMLLEPRQLFGLYQWKDYDDLIDEGGVVPVYRLPGDPEHP